MLIPLALPLDPGFELAVASQGMSQGLAQTDGLQVVPRATVRAGAVQVGGQWKNIDASTFSGVAAVFVRYSRRVGKAQLDAGVAYRIRTGATGPAPSEAWELSAGARQSFGKAALRLGAEYSPSDFGAGRSLYVELGPTFDLDQSTRLSAGVGRRERAGPTDYTAFNAGMSRTVRQGLSLDARYHATDRADLGPRYRSRMVVSARLTL